MYDDDLKINCFLIFSYFRIYLLAIWKRKEKKQMKKGPVKTLWKKP